MQQPPALTAVAQWVRAPAITEIVTLIQVTAARRRWLVTRAIAEAAPMRAAATTEPPLARRVLVASRARLASRAVTVTLRMAAKSI
jgi:hypothetical protein